ncbi:nucleoporin 35 isoform X2 [Lycorma delicatula]|uniref:nucleoporin 35 isoform X2 n=1 Tax=Lycorma delicatula TaxID=130591 RepID=UPI003F5189A3
MEPMSLGSPVGSPSSPSSGSAFLPAFLMGEQTHNPHPSSPTKTARQVNIGSLQTTPRALNFNNVSPVSERRSRTVHVNQVEKPSGPPIQGLFDTLESTTVPASSSSNINVYPNQSITLPSTSTPYRPSDQSTNIENWVTVFGFPPSASSTILNHFSQLGQLLESRFPPKGNWVNLHYYSKMEARRALTYHGKVFGGTTMIGVMPCKDPNVNKDSSVLESPASVLPNRLISSPTNYSTSVADTSYLQSPNVRPLSRSHRMDNEVLSQQNAPIRNNGLVSRTLDYIFGW